jgi:hypothetical protein
MEAPDLTLNPETGYLPDLLVVFPSRPTKMVGQYLKNKHKHCFKTPAIHHKSHFPTSRYITYTTLKLSTYAYAQTLNFSLHCAQICSGAHPASYSMGTRGSFSGVKAAGA